MRVRKTERDQQDMNVPRAHHFERREFTGLAERLSYTLKSTNSSACFTEGSNGAQNELRIMDKRFKKINTKTEDENLFSFCT